MAKKSVPIEIVGIRNKRQKVFSLALVFVVGVLLVGIASLLEVGFFRTVLTSIGSVIIGFGLTSVITQIFSPAPLEGVLAMINELLLVPWRSKEEELAPFRKKFFGYLYTLREGKPVWIYRDFDFGNLELPGYLHAAIQYPTINNKTVRYKYYGFPVQSRLLLIGRNAQLGNEPAVVQVIPNCGQSGIYAGLAFFETVSGEQIIAPTLLSTDQLVEAPQVGTLSDEYGLILSEVWNSNFKNNFHFPATYRNNSILGIR